MGNRDTWLYGNEGGGKAGQRDQRKLKDFIAKSKGLLDPASDHVYRMLMHDPVAAAQAKAKITHYGGDRQGRDPDGRVVSISKGAPDHPESRQLRDPFTTFYVQGIALEPPLPPERLLNLTEENTLHSGCLMAKATDAAGRGWAFKPREGKESDKTLIESDLPATLKEVVAGLTPDVTFSELLYQAVWEMDAIGWGVWEVVRTHAQKWKPGQYAPIGAVYPIPSHTIRASLDGRKWIQIRAGRVRYFKKFGAQCDINNETGTILDWKDPEDLKQIGKMDTDYLASELIIFKTYTPRSLWYGVPKWVSAIATIAELTAIREFNVSWFASGGQTDYHMHFSASSVDVAKQMVEQVETQMRENAGRGHTNLLTAGSEDTKVVVSKLGELLREGHFRFRRGDLSKEVLIAHTVPPYRVGWAETGALAGSPANEMLESYKFGAIKPIQVVLEERLRGTLFDDEMGIKTGDFRFRLHELEMDDITTELSKLNAGMEGGAVTPNQWREGMGLDPDDTNPALSEYYYKGTKLGAPPPAPPGGPPFEGQDGQNGGQPTDEVKSAAGDPIAVIERFEMMLKDALAEKE